MKRLNILNSINVPVWVFDVDRSRISWANTSAVKYWNSPDLDELCSRDLSRDMSDAVRLRLQQYRTDCSLSDETFHEEWTLYPNNIPKTTRVAFSRYVFEDGRVALLAQITDHTVNASPVALHSMQALMHTSAMISVFDTDLDLIYANPEARRAFGTSDLTLSEYLVNPQDLSRLLTILTTESSSNIELPVNTQDGQRWHAMNIQSTPDPVSGRKTYLISATDITENKNIQQQVIDRAYTDPLTGLPNRLAVIENLQTRIETDKGQPFALLYLDLTRFKLVNDTLGHKVGDSLLLTIAKRLQEIAGDNNLVARLSGDEFVITLDTAEQPHIDTVLQQILQLARHPMSIDGYKLRISPCIGVSLYPQDGNQAATLLQHADIAKYTSKSLATGLQYFNPDMGKSIKNRLSLESDLAEAIASKQFELYYQPKVSAHDFAVVELEALIRWQHPTRGMVSPLEFIPIAEESGLIIEIGDWVIRQALSDQAAWEKTGHDISVAVNVSPKQFMSPDFLYRLQDALAASACRPQMLNLEVTESSLIGDEHHVQKILNQLSADGIKISIDDFGTGYSNLANLHKYPIHCLKIDRAFLSDKDNKSLLTTILEMGKLLKMTVVAEGVENQQQIEWLRAQQCDQLQGYYFSKPQPLKAIIEYMGRQQGTPRQREIIAA